jgi:hypothetical protein
VLALTTFRPDARSQWWWAKYAKLDDLVQDMKYQKKSEADASEEFKKFLHVHEPKYPGFGKCSFRVCRIMKSRTESYGY